MCPTRTLSFDTTLQHYFGIELVSFSNKQAARWLVGPDPTVPASNPVTHHIFSSPSTNRTIITFAPRLGRKRHPIIGRIIKFLAQHISINDLSSTSVGALGIFRRCRPVAPIKRQTRLVSQCWLRLQQLSKGGRIILIPATSSLESTNTRGGCRTRRLRQRRSAA